MLYFASTKFYLQEKGAIAARHGRPPPRGGKSSRTGRGCPGLGCPRAQARGGPVRRSEKTQPRRGPRKRRDRGNHQPCEVDEDNGVVSYARACGIPQTGGQACWIGEIS